MVARSGEFISGSFLAWVLLCTVYLIYGSTWYWYIPRGPTSRARFIMIKFLWCLLVLLCPTWILGGWDSGGMVARGALLAWTRIRTTRVGSYYPYCFIFIYNQCSILFYIGIYTCGELFCWLNLQGPPGMPFDYRCRSLLFFPCTCFYREKTRVGYLLLGSGDFPLIVIYNGIILDFLGCTYVWYLLIIFWAIFLVG